VSVRLILSTRLIIDVKDLFDILKLHCLFDVQLKRYSDLFCK
jgi:serine/threonine protein phosphatase PrpC